MTRATAVNNSRVSVDCFLFDVIVFAMLPAHGIWRETVSLLDVMQGSCDNELANEWARCSEKNASYITIIDIILWLNLCTGTYISLTETIV